MKRAFRDRALNRLYADLRSDDFDVREFALFQLALMLRRANGDSSMGDFPASEPLSRELNRIRLSPADQQQIVAHLMRLMSRHADSRASAFWTLAVVSAELVFAQACAAIGELGDQLGDEAAYQSCRALLRWLSADDFDTSLVDELLAEEGPLPWLRRWSRSTDARLARNAHAVISSAQAFRD